ncbi:hypothetical protein EV702DRAFT_1241383 [Suillus placidus]|uniref:CCHC-type domain-containing protein n=1 Tax=Suillus placidus TaxID=48579 RepID=A0A9P6ZP90_9AGAM|nr:hypothetical protein EV702DRAFT_1241383 [Suillus placidus]
MSDPTNSSKAFKVSKLADFDGSKDTFVAWFRHVLMYFESQDTVVPTPKQKIIFTMSYMKTGYAGEWAALAYDREKAKSLSHHWDWDAFVKDLKAAFSPINEICDTQEHLATFTQGKMLIKEFLTRWMQILVTAEYLNVKAGTTTSMKNQKCMVVEISRSGRSEFWLKAGFLNGVMLDKMPSASQPNPTSSASADQTDGSGVIYGGHGQPMDLSRQRARENNLCYRCGQAGHIARNCKNHVQAIRQMLDGLNDEEKKGVVKSLGF